MASVFPSNIARDNVLHIQMFVFALKMHIKNVLPSLKCTHFCIFTGIFLLPWLACLLFYSTRHFRTFRYVCNSSGDSAPHFQLYAIFYSDRLLIILPSSIGCTASACKPYFFSSNSFFNFIIHSMSFSLFFLLSLPLWLHFYLFIFISTIFLYRSNSNKFQWKSYPKENKFPLTFSCLFPQNFLKLSYLLAICS